MTPPLQNRTHRKVVYATDADLERLALLRTLVEHDALFFRHPLHEAELFRAALALAAAPLGGGVAGDGRGDPATFLLGHITAEREQSQQVHALKMQEAQRKARERRAPGRLTEQA